MHQRQQTLLVPATAKASAESHSEAFTTLYRQYAGALLHYACRTLRHREDAEELVHEVFESLWQRWPELSHIESFKSYLYGAMRHKILHHLRHQKVKDRYAEHYRLFEAAYQPAHEEGEELLSRLLAALEGLPDRCRQAMHLRLTENLTNAEIAARMGVSKETVENYMVKAVGQFVAKQVGQFE